METSGETSISNSLPNFNLSNFNLPSNSTGSEIIISQKAIQDLIEWFRNRTVNPIGAINNVSSTAAKIDTATCTYCDGLVWESFTDYRAVHGYLTLVICILGTIGNILNIIVLTRPELGTTPINLILKWLAVTDMFVMMEYIPFTCYQYIILPADRNNRKNAFTWAAYLLFHMHFSQILHTISISLTVTLALWRYIAIKHPHGRFASCILGRTGNAIFACFIISPLLCFPTYFVFSIDETFDQHAKTTLYHVNADADSALYSFNFWVHSIIIKLLPCCILTIISCILIEVLYTASKRRVKLKSYGNVVPSNGVSCPTAGPLMERKPPRTNRRTDRTTMLLVAVLILFLITEFPQGILGLLSAILDQCFFKKCYSLFGEFMDLLALINGAVGFVLYGLMSKQFRTTFKSLFFKKHVDNLELTRVTGTTSCG